MEGCDSGTAVGYAPPVQGLNRLGSLKRGAGGDRRKAGIKQLEVVSFSEL